MYTDHPDYKAFLVSILDNPGDDTPRLAFADWLDETGDPDAARRAAFIRESIDRWAKGDRRAHWFGALGHCRGFVGAACCGWNEWVRYGPQWLPTRPIQDIVFTDAKWVTLRIERDQRLTKLGPRSAWILTARVDAPELVRPRLVTEASQNVEPVTLPARTIPAPVRISEELAQDAATLNGYPLVTMLFEQERTPRLALKWQFASPANEPADRLRFIRDIGPQLREFGRAVRKKCDTDGYPLRTAIDRFPGGFPDEWRQPILSR